MISRDHSSGSLENYAQHGSDGAPKPQILHCCSQQGDVPRLIDPEWQQHALTHTGHRLLRSDYPLVPEPTSLERLLLPPLLVAIEDTDLPMPLRGGRLTEAGRCVVQVSILLDSMLLPGLD